MDNQSYINQSTESNIGMFNNAQNFTVNGGKFEVAGKDINYYYLSSDEEKELQEWLNAPNCSINYATALNKRAHGTGQWIFQDSTYLKWREEGSILWIQGQAGSGKTFLITSIIKDLKKITCSTIVAYHYFDTRDNSGAKTSFQGLLLSLLLQLGAQNQKIHSALKKLHELSKNGLSHSMPPNEDLIITLQKIIEDLVQKEWHIHLIIDALDECKEMNEVWKFCVHIMELHPIGIIISSRNYQVKSSKYATISLWKNNRVDEDIATFLDEQVEDFAILIVNFNY
ncbi:hypothetical protein EV361DRAFT_872948 [Lentinula raphanica]|nr:hypothetical protein EV361DRAFT_872948 [Lentinula raphanica]